MGRHLRSVIASLALALQATAALAYPAGVVLCIAEDGHVSVETAHETVRCTADWERHHPDATSTSDVDAHPCTDTFVSQSAARSVPVGTDDAFALSMPGAAVAFRSASWTGASTTRVTGPPDRLTALRSVVLRV
jgi:hypothetical protein